MISVKYKEMYNTFIKHYIEKHVNPWHEINEEELNSIYNSIINFQDIDDDYSFNYLMNYVIKRLSGISDAHTSYDDVERLPINFKVFGNEIIVNYPEELKGAQLTEINNIDINKVIEELENVVTYGTDGKRIYEIEKSLFNRKKLFGLPIFRNQEKIAMKLINNNGTEVVKEFFKNEKYSDEEIFDYDVYRFGSPGTYNMIDTNLVINHSSVQKKYEERINNMINELNKLDLSNIENVIVDIRGNTGGYSMFNKPLMDFLSKSEKNIICLTDYRIFSGGRYALLDLIKLGATTIGTDISTPLNCYGNSDWIEYEKHYFSSSSAFLAPNIGWSASSKKEFRKEATSEIIKPVYFHPDIYIKQSKEDYMNDIDTVLEYALKYTKSNEKGLSK